MKIPNYYDVIQDSTCFESWLQKQDTEKILIEIQHAVDVHYSLYFKEEAISKYVYFVHPLVKIIFSYYESLVPKYVQLGLL